VLCIIDRIFCKINTFLFDDSFINELFKDSIICLILKYSIKLHSDCEIY
jgi:hypothetical protein